MIRLDPRAKPIASLSGQLELRLLTPSVAFWVVGIILTHYRLPRRYPRALILFLSKPCPANPVLDSIESLNSLCRRGPLCDPVIGRPVRPELPQPGDAEKSGYLRIIEE